MKLPALNGSCDHKKFFLYTACDSKYFDDFAPSLVNSVLENAKMPLHIHIFNPTPKQLAFCQQPKLSCTWEYAELDLFDNAAKRWKGIDNSNDFYRRTTAAMAKGGDASLQERLQKTYYACARFIRLSELFNENVGAFAIDIDAVVRKKIGWLPDSKMYIHRVTGMKNWYMAGGIYLNPCQEAKDFLSIYSQKLTTSIEHDDLYWGLDQDQLEITVPRDKCGQLPTSLIDWHMRDTSIIWTAKGTRKSLAKFINEQKKYIA